MLLIFVILFPIRIYLIQFLWFSCTFSLSKGVYTTLYFHPVKALYSVIKSFFNLLL